LATSQIENTSNADKLTSGHFGAVALSEEGGATVERASAAEPMAANKKSDQNEV
jgi:hypothetical protein